MATHTDENMLDECGLMYKIDGSFYGRQWVCFHELCVMWCSNVYVDQRNKLRGLEFHLRVPEDRECYVCEQKGVINKCYEEKCERYFHFFCAREDGCVFSNWNVYCPLHKDDYFFEDPMEEGQSHEEETK